MFATKQNLRRGAALIAGALAFAAAAPAAANADSIAYVKDGNVYLSTSDGSRQYQVTTAGGYSSVSQDDYGNMIAAHGTRLHYLGRDGSLRADFYTPVSTGPGAQNGADGRQWYGPFDPKLSPDGSRVAYHWYYRNITGGCLPDYGNTVCVYMRQGTAYSKPDQITSLDDPAHKSQSGWIYPTWVRDGIGADATVLSSPSPSIGNEDLVMHTPYPFEGTDGLTRWAEDPDVELHDGEFSRDQRKMAYVAGDSHELLRIYRTPQGLYPYYPRGCYQFGDPVGGRFEGPSWSPDGSKLAFAQGDGIYVADVPALTNDPCDAGATEARMLIPGARSADWGPADVPPARVVVDPPRPPVDPPRRPIDQPRTPVRTPDNGGGRNGDGGGNGGGGNGGGGNGGGGNGGGSVVTTSSGDRVALPSKAITAKALAGAGVKLDVTCTKACRVTTTLRVNAATARKLRLGKQRTVGSASARLAKGGSKALTVKVSPRLRARFARVAARSTVKLVVKIAPAKGKATTKTLSLKVK